MNDIANAVIKQTAHRTYYTERKSVFYCTIDGRYAAAKNAGSVACTAEVTGDRLALIEHRTAVLYPTPGMNWFLL